jgi:hypothetical protein
MALTLEEVAYRVLPRVIAGRSLADSEWRTLVRAAETLLEGSAARVEFERVADNVERFLATGRSRTAWRVRVLLTLIEFLPLLHGRASFSALSLAERRAWIEARWTGRSGLASLCARVRVLVLMGAYGDARAVSDIGLVPVALRTGLPPGSPPGPRRLERERVFGRTAVP